MQTKKNARLLFERRESRLSVIAWQLLALQVCKFKDPLHAPLRAAEHIRDAK